MEITLENKQKVFNYLERLGYKAKIINKTKKYLDVLFK